MKTIQTEIIINASVNQIWDILMDHQAYSEWNPFIKSINGSAAVGEILSVHIQQEGKKPMEFTPTVLVNTEAKEFRWLGRLFVKGLFDGEHFFQLIPLSPTQTKFIHGEHFRGVFVKVLLKMIGESTLAGFQAMNQALKEKAEAINILSKSA